MLLAIRERATGIIAWIIVILLIIPFALWGIQEYLGGGAEVNVAEVDGSEISWYAFSDAYEAAVQRAGERPTGAAASRLKRAVLERVIEEQLVLQTARQVGLRIGDRQVLAHIASLPAFQTEGRFDRQLYEQLLRQNRLDKVTFEEQQRQQLVKQQFRGAISDTAFITDHELDEMIRLRDREVDLAYAVIPAQRFREGIEVTDEQIRAYYDQHPEAFRTPEQVKLAYLKLDVRDIESTIEVSEERLRARYEQQKDSLYRPEQRSAAHILIAVEEDADEAAVAAAREKAQALYGRIQEGASFAELAKEHSDDPGSAANGGKLGVVRSGTLDERFEQALFALEREGAVSEPVRSAFGFHLIKLTQIKPGEQKSFDEAREELRRQIRREEAEDLFYERSELLYDLTYQNPLSLEPAAEAVGLQIRQTDWVGRGGAGEGIASDPKVMEAAFSEDVLAGGSLNDALNSQLIELAPEDRTRISPVAVIRVREYRASQLRPMEQVREEIAGRIRGQRAREQARALAEELLTALRGGDQDLEALAEARGLELKTPGYVGRGAQGHDPAVVSAAFGLGAPSEGGSRHTRVDLAAGDVALVAVRGVRDGKPDEATETVRQAMRQFLERLYGRSELTAMTDQVRRAADVTVNERVLERGE